MQSRAFASDGDHYTRAANEDCINGGPRTRTKYAYDANGNVTSRNGSIIGWTSYNYPSGVNTATESATFDYGPNHQRWRMIYTGPSGNETTFYATPLYETIFRGGPSIHHQYIYAGGRPVVEVSTTNGVVTVQSLLVDHQGSISSVVTDSTGASLVSESFTPYGNRREASTWSGAPTSGKLTTMNGVTREGYTFQTVLGSMGLNHMNGRIEDSVTGRFLSPDPRGTIPGNTQSWNRYSYVNNNPLSFIDPTGFDQEDCAGGGGACPETPNTDPCGPGGCDEIIVPCTVNCGPDHPTPPPPDFIAPSFDPPGGGAIPTVVIPQDIDEIIVTAQRQKNSIKNWLCNAGNSLASGSDLLGNASGKLELIGLGASGVGVVTAQPEVVAAGLAIAATGGVGNIGAGALQLGAGLMQGFGGGGFSNAGYATLSLATGFTLARGITGPAVSGYRTVSQRSADAFASGAATVTGGVNDLFASLIDAFAPKQVNCPGGN